MHTSVLKGKSEAALSGLLFKPAQAGEDSVFWLFW